MNTKFVESLKLSGNGLKLSARIEGGRVVFSGGKTGDASIALDVSSRARIEAHWSGYCENNGLRALPVVGEKVTFRRGMFGVWPGLVQSVCSTSAVIRFRRKNGSETERRVPISDVMWAKELNRA